MNSSISKKNWRPMRYSCPLKLRTFVLEGKFGHYTLSMPLNSANIPNFIFGLRSAGPRPASDAGFGAEHAPSWKVPVPFFTGCNHLSVHFRSKHVDDQFDSN